MSSPEERRQIVAQMQADALKERRERRGAFVGDLPEAPLTETKAASWGTENWPDGLTIYPIAHGRGVPAGAYKSGSDMGMAANSAIYACVNTVATYFKEPSVKVFRDEETEAGGMVRREPEEHSIKSLLRAPNRVGPSKSYPVAFSWSDLAWINQWNKHVDGNSYWLKIRSGRAIYGNVVALWPIPPYMIEPVGPNDKAKKYGDDTIIDPLGDKRFIDHYLYDPWPGVIRERKIDPRDIIHFRLNTDPTNYRKGIGPVRLLAREVASDELAAEFTNALLKNSAIPGLIVVPEDGWVDEEVAQQIKRRMKAEFGDGNQGGVSVLSAGAKVEQFGFDPSSLSLLNIHKHCEERIAAVMNIPAMVAQLGAGLDQASQFSNFFEAREMMTENTLVPLWKSDGEKLTGQLLGDFSSREDEYLLYDYENDVRALQKDLTDKFGRLQIGVKGGWLTANEARQHIGMPPIDAKEEQVPLTQGEDNRLNLLVEKGLLTLNEVRLSVGMEEMEGGDVLLRDYAPDAGWKAEPNQEPGQNKLPVRPVGEIEQQEPRDPTRGEAVPVEGRQGSNVGEQDMKALAVEIVMQTLTPDEVHILAKKARDAGTTFHEVARRVVDLP
jgi:HK97 family phage portal protein